MRLLSLSSILFFGALFLFPGYVSADTAGFSCVGSNGQTGTCMFGAINCSATPLASASCDAGQICCPTGSSNTNTNTNTQTNANPTSGSSIPVSCPNGTIKGGVCFPSGTGLSSMPIEDLLMRVMNWLLGIFGFLAIIAFVISGFQYLVSAGDEGMAETAKRNMQYAAIGILVALSGWVIIMAIDQALSGNPWF